MDMRVEGIQLRIVCFMTWFDNPGFEPKLGIIEQRLNRQCNYQSHVYYLMTNGRVNQGNTIEKTTAEWKLYALVVSLIQPAFILPPLLFLSHFFLHVNEVKASFYFSATSPFFVSFSFSFIIIVFIIVFILFPPHRQFIESNKSISEKPPNKYWTRLIEISKVAIF